MQVVLLRVGIDTGSGGILGPLLSDGSFEYIPIPDDGCTDERTYGNICGRHGRRMIDYFPEARRETMSCQSIHFDPEFRTFTYGDPTAPKASLQRLSAGSLLVFYAGLRGWGFKFPPALYIIGYFEVTHAGLATRFTHAGLRRFRNNFHVMHADVFRQQKQSLVLVKGGRGSRLLEKAVRISSVGKDTAGRPLHRLSPEMQKVFGDFEGHTGIQRSPPRWVAPEFTTRAARFVRALR
jgi:hypothetical protein